MHNCGPEGPCRFPETSSLTNSHEENRDVGVKALFSLVDKPQAVGAGSAVDILHTRVVRLQRDRPHTAVLLSSLCTEYYTQYLRAGVYLVVV